MCALKGLLALRRRRLITRHGCSDLLHEDSDRPPIEEDVVVRPDELPMLICHANQGKAHERGAGQVEPATTIPVEKLLQHDLLFRHGVAPPVLLLPRQLHRMLDNLYRRARLPFKPAAETLACRSNQLVCHASLSRSRCSGLTSPD